MLYLQIGKIKHHKNLTFIEGSSLWPTEQRLNQDQNWDVWSGRRRSLAGMKDWSPAQLAFSCYSQTRGYQGLRNQTWACRAVSLPLSPRIHQTNAVKNPKEIRWLGSESRLQFSCGLANHVITWYLKIMSSAWLWNSAGHGNIPSPSS